MTLAINRRAGAAARAARFPILGHIDPVLTACTIAVACIGAVMVFSATRGPGAGEPLTTYFFTRQAMFVVIGIGLFAAASFFDYRHLRDWALPLTVGTAGLLFLVVFLGASSKGGQRSFAFAGFQLQPSEFAKVVFVIGLASFLTYDREEVEMDNRRLGICLGLTALPIGLIMLQPDLGTALVFGVTALAMLTVAGAKPKQMAVLFGAAALCVAAVLMSGILAEYQQDRLTVFLDAGSQDSQGAAYNQTQSQKTIGSGGLAGQGLFEGRQTGLGFVPEQHTDFIFTVVGEETGFMGSALLLVLFGLILWRTWRTAHLAREPFGMLVCTGVLGIFLFQIFENAGMALGIMPVTGIPLPLVSYGGSSVLAMFLALGVVHSVHMHRFS
jgi:rod shape determining protein RodA